MLTEELRVYGGDTGDRRCSLPLKESAAWSQEGFLRCNILHLRRSVNIIYRGYILIVRLVKSRMSVCPFVGLSERNEW